MKFLEYKKCSTCKQAKKWLDEHNTLYQDIDIVKDTPKVEDLRKYYEKSKLPIKRFFNTSGLVYKNLGLKDKLDTMTLDEKLELLASNGMLIKRPILVGNDFVLLGFKKEEWERKLK